MQCRMVELRYKEVINICDGCRLGFVGDVEVMLPEGRVAALIVPGPCRFFGLFGRGEEFYIPWECIKQIGDDIILIDAAAGPCSERRKIKEKKIIFRKRQPPVGAGSARKGPAAAAEMDFPGKNEKCSCQTACSCIN